MLTYTIDGEGARESVKKLRVLILCGGRSAERRVSLVSARLVFSKLDRARFAPELVYIDAEGRWLKAGERLLAATVQTGEPDVSGLRVLTGEARLSPSSRRPDAVFPVLHGPLGEDGTVQGLLEVAGLPYVGCGVLGSALAMDKELTKRLAIREGLPLLPYRVVRDPRRAAEATARLGLPVFVKPARLGSSVGVSKVKEGRGLAGAVREALRYDDKLVIEKGIEAREIECALLGDPWSPAGKDPLGLRASVCGEIAPNAEFYSYESKYLDPDGAKLTIPAAIGAKIARQVQDLALRAFRALDGYGMARADFLMDKRTGRVYFNEINTIPGFTGSSMYPLLWKASGVDTPELLTRLVELALRRHRARARLKTSP